MSDLPQKLQKTNRQTALLALKENRNAEHALESYWRGDLEKSDLTDKELRMLRRYQWLMSHLNDLKGVKYDRGKVIEAHMKFNNVEIATANRDLALVSKHRQRLMQADVVFIESYLIEEIYEAISYAKTGERPEQGAAAVARLAAAAEKILSKYQDTGGGFDASKMEQHINILIADPLTNHILKEMIAQNVSVNKHNMNLDEILALEKQFKAEADAQKTEDIDHEEI
jgi:hypothetical protein